MNEIKQIIRRINMNVSSSKQNIKVLSFVTDMEENIEKTLIVNMAMMYGFAGKKTLILDTDFGNEAIAHTFHIDSKNGLSDYLEGKVTELSKIENQIQNKNISIIAAGSLAKAETDYLIGDPRFEELLTKLRSEYDTILIVTPRFQSQAVMENILHKSDGAILVASTGKSTKRKMYKLIKSVSQSDTELLGYVAVKR